LLAKASLNEDNDDKLSAQKCIKVNPGLISASVTPIPNVAAMSRRERCFNAISHRAEFDDVLWAEVDSAVFGLPPAMTGGAAASLAACPDSNAIVLSSRYTASQVAESTEQRLAVARVPIARVLYRVSRSVSPRLLSNFFLA
jgi:hypothetical protein